MTVILTRSQAAGVSLVAEAAGTVQVDNDGRVAVVFTTAGKQYTVGAKGAVKDVTAE